MSERNLSKRAKRTRKIKKKKITKAEAKKAAILLSKYFSQQTARSLCKAHTEYHWRESLDGLRVMKGIKHTLGITV